jgi:hypothetical protein
VDLSPVFLEGHVLGRAFKKVAHLMSLLLGSVFPERLPGVHNSGALFGQQLALVVAAVAHRNPLFIVREVLERDVSEYGIIPV